MALKGEGSVSPAIVFDCYLRNPPFPRTYVRLSIVTHFNNPPPSVLRLSYSSRGVKDVYRCFCFILRSLLAPQYIKYLRRPHYCCAPRIAYGVKRRSALCRPLRSRQLLISSFYCTSSSSQLRFRIIKTLNQNQKHFRQLSSWRATLRRRRADYTRLNFFKTLLCLYYYLKRFRIVC